MGADQPALMALEIVEPRPPHQRAVGEYPEIVGGAHKVEKLCVSALARSPNKPIPAMQRIIAAIGGSSTAMAQLPSRSRTRQYVVLVLAVVLMAGGWIGFWKYAANAAQENLENWRAREARAGRILGCGSQEIGGFPFRFELKCDGASAVLGGGQIPVELKAANVHIAAQVYQPTLLISELTGPLTIGDPGRPPAYTANWKLAQSSISGLPRSAAPGLAGGERAGDHACRARRASRARRPYRGSRPACGRLRVRPARHRVCV